MRVLLVVSLLLIATAAVAVPGAEAKVRTCPDVGGTFKIKHVTAAHATCKTAKRIIRKSFLGDGVHAGKYTCTTKSAPGPKGAYVRTCTAGKRVVSWHGVQVSES